MSEHPGTGRDVRQRALQAVLDVLPKTAGRRITKRVADTSLIIGEQVVRVGWAGEGNLGDVRSVLAPRSGRPDVVVARRLSPGARQALTAADVGWVDESGAAEIAIGSIIVSRTGRPPAPVEPSMRWSPSVVAIAEALLCGVRATVTATATATGLSTGSCTNALRVLTGLGLLEADVHRGRGSARRVGDVDQLLASYATAVEAKPTALELQVGAVWRDPVDGLMTVGQTWDDANVEWAATGAVAASILAPLLTSFTSADVYVAADTVVGLEAVAARAGLRPVEGGRLTLRPFPSVTVRRLATDADGLRISPWPRVYVDLRSSGVRGEDAAEHLREVIHARRT